MYQSIFIPNHPHPVSCWSGTLSFSFTAQGDVLSCGGCRGRDTHYLKYLNTGLLLSCIFKAEGRIGEQITSINHFYFSLFSAVHLPVKAPALQEQAVWPCKIQHSVLIRRTHLRAENRVHTRQQATINAWNKSYEPSGYFFHVLWSR